MGGRGEGGGGGGVDGGAWLPLAAPPPQPANITHLSPCIKTFPFMTKHIAIMTMNFLITTMLGMSQLEEESLILKAYLRSYGSTTLHAQVGRHMML